MEQHSVASKGKRSTPLSKRALSSSKKSTLSSIPLDIFTVRRSRRKPWCVRELASKINVDNPMTPKSAAAFLGLDEKTITRWARKGYLPGHPLGEGKRKFWRFIESELSDWLAAQTNRDGAATTKEGRAA